MPEQSLAGKVAIVSGSDSGIGAVIVRELSSRGAYTVVNYPFPKMRSRAEALVASLPCRSIAVEADLSTTDGPQRLVEAAVSAFDHIDILVNNVGIAINKSFEDQTLADWDLLVNLNGRGTFLLTQAAIQHFPAVSTQQNQGGNSRIVNICSLSSRNPPPNQTIYAGTKGMVDSFTRCWAKELPQKFGCTVNSVSPGPTKTEGFADAGVEQMKILQPIIDQTPVAPRLGEASEVAYAVAFLCEPRSGWVNGEHMAVCGGLVVD